MLPEILDVIVDDGAEIHVPLTPSTTFQDVAECVREPGETLPIILEQSPSGFRLVAFWEHPLEILQLWGKLKKELRFAASYTWTKHLQNGNTKNGQAKWLNNDQINALSQIDPWELYDLRDQLKGLGILPYFDPISRRYMTHGQKTGKFANNASDAESSINSSSAMSFDTNDSFERNPGLDSSYNNAYKYNPGMNNISPLYKTPEVCYPRITDKVPINKRIPNHIRNNKDPNKYAKTNATKTSNDNPSSKVGKNMSSLSNSTVDRQYQAKFNDYLQMNPLAIQKTKKHFNITNATNDVENLDKGNKISYNGEIKSQSTKPVASSNILRELSTELDSARQNCHQDKLHPDMNKDTNFRRTNSERGPGSFKQMFWRTKSLQKSQAIRQRPKSNPEVEQLVDQLQNQNEEAAESTMPKDAIRLGKNEGMKNTQSNLQLIPDGGEVTVPELREMATRQQHQIETQQQLLVAREQRLKYLKMQEGKVTQINHEAEKLRRLRERVEAQEAKLRRLRALRGQVDTTNLSSASLSSDLDEMRSLFSEKEKELVMAAAKVEELTRQLEDLRTGRGTVTAAVTAGPTIQKHHQELDKLRRELLYRNSVSREASVRVASQREAMVTRKEEIVRIDKRIAELQQRLQRKKVLNQQLATQISAATHAKQAQLKAIERKELRERENTTDDLATEEHKNIEGYSEFERGKHDPKYQTLPYNTKFSSGRTGRQEQENFDDSADNISADNQIPITTQSDANGHLTSIQSRFPPTWTEEIGNVSPNISQVQDSKSALPATSLSVSFAHKLSPGVTTYSQNRILNYSEVKDEELAKNKGVSGLINDYEGDVIGKPQLPPKPPVRPTPPPRQKGEPGSIDTSEPSTPKISAQSRPQQAVRYASQNVIMSTYTQKQDQNSTQKSELHQEDTKDDDAKIHVTINRRIEMPPAFMFPEGQLTSTDLLNQTEDNRQIDNDGVIAINDKNDVICANGALKQQIAEHDGSLSQQLSSLAVNDSPSESLYAYIPQLADLRQHIDITDDANLIISRDNNGSHYEFLDNGNSEYRDNSCSSEETGNSSESNTEQPRQIQIVDSEGNVVINRRIKKGNLKTNTSRTANRRVSFDPLALLLDASLEGELDLVKKTAKEVPNPSAANDEGITALHNAICAGHLDIVTFLVLYGYDVNAQDADGWTPLHCAASCNNVQMARFLVDNGACVLSTTLQDHETAAEKCEQEEDGYDSCSQYLYSVQEKLGIMNGGVVYAVYDYEAQSEDEIKFKNGDAITVLRRGDEYERNWWWSRLDDSCGYVPRNLLGLYPRVKSPARDS